MRTWQNSTHSKAMELLEDRFGKRVGHAIGTVVLVLAVLAVVTVALNVIINQGILPTANWVSSHTDFSNLWSVAVGASAWVAASIFIAQAAVISRRKRCSN